MTQPNNEPDQDDSESKNIMDGDNLLEDSFFDSDVVDLDADEGTSPDDFSTVTFDVPSEDDLADDDFKTPEEVNELLKREVSSQPLKSVPIPKSSPPPKPALSSTPKTQPKPQPAKPKKTNEEESNNFMNPTADSEYDPEKQYSELWKALTDDEGANLKIMASRLEPQTLKGVKISGYLEAFYMPTTVPDIIEQIGIKYGGGKYQLKVVDNNGKYVKSKVFEIAGFPKIPDAKTEEEIKKSEEEPTDSEQDLELDDSDTDDGDSLDFQSNRPQPVTAPWQNQWGGNAPNWNNPSPFGNGSTNFFPNGNGNGFGGANGNGFGGFRDQFKEKEDTSEKIKKELDTKIGGLQQTISSLVNNLSNRKEETKPLVTPELVQAALPLFTVWFEKGSSKDNVLAQQFDQMNQRMVNLVESLREMTRINDKSKEEMIERERRERETARKEMLENQQRAEERLQNLMAQMHSSLEKRFTSESAVEEKLRKEFLTAQEEARRREEAAREEARRREDDARRREEEFREKIRQEEARWREELRQREEEAKKAEIRWREEIRQKELASERDSRQKELEVQNHLRQLDIEKFKAEQKMLEQVYSSKAGNNDQRLNLELALAKITGENDMKLLQAQSQMELEKLKLQTQMTIEKMRNELETTETKAAVKDPLEEAIADHMKKKTYLMIVNQLKLEEQNPDQQPEETTMGTVLKRVINQGTDSLQGLLKIILGGEQPAPATPPGRIVQSNPPAKPINKPPVATTGTVRTGTNPEPVEPQPEPTQPNIQEMQEQVAKISQFFDYLKEAVDKGEDPAAAVDVAHEILPEVVLEHLATVEDSSAIIKELEPLFAFYNPEYVPFFTQEPVRLWLNKVLAGIRDSFEIIEEEEIPSPPPAPPTIPSKVSDKKPATENGENK